MAFLMRQAMVTRQLKTVFPSHLSHILLFMHLSVFKIPPPRYWLQLIWLIAIIF